MRLTKRRGEGIVLKRPCGTLPGVRANLNDRAVCGVKDHHSCEASIYRERKGGEQEHITE
jgi:hypothetical protein